MAYPPLEDDTPIPFGKHKGTRMIELPISYLMWALEKAEEGSAVNVYAKKNEKWIRAEGTTGKHNRPVRQTGVDRNPPEPSKPKPPNLMTAVEFIRKELGLTEDAPEDDPAIGMSISKIAHLAIRYKNYFNGTPNLKPLPKIEQPKGEKMMGWSSEPIEEGWKHGDDPDKAPF